MAPQLKRELSYNNAKGENAYLEEILTDVPSPNIDINALGVSNFPAKNIFSADKRKGWNKSIEARCDFNKKIRLTKRSGIFFISLWQKSVYGRTLSEIKSDKSMIGYFASHIANLILSIAGENLDMGNWAICTTPKRRHKTNNFASMICEIIAKILNIKFYEDTAICTSRQRVNASFILNKIPEESNIIVFDDFVTTGQTLKAMNDIFINHKKNIVFFAGINNQL